MGKEIFEDEIQDVDNLDNTKVLDIKDEIGSNDKKPNKKKLIIILSVVAVILLIIITLLILHNNKQKDKPLEKESVVILGKNYEVFGTTELIIDSTTLTTNDINNIKRLEHLNKLDIKSVTIDDISFIDALKKLTVLKLNVSTKVNDFSVLEKLPNLFTLEIYGNIGKSADMSSFSKLDKVSTLYLSMHQDRNIDFISEMKGLSLLSLDCSIDLYNEIIEKTKDTKIKIETHGELSKMDLTKPSTNIDDGIINWSMYDVNTTQVITINITPEYKDITKLQSELEKLGNYKNLKSLTISTTDYNSPISINDFNFLKNLTNLEMLSIDYLNANDISAIGELSNLKKLSLTNSNMANAKFSPLSKLTKIEELNLSMQNITDITFLSEYKNLKVLYLNGNNYTSIESLKNLTNLTQLYIGCNKSLNDFSALESLVNLNTLMLTLDKIDTTIFSKLTKLKTLYVGISLENLEELKTTYPNIKIEQVSECV